MTTPWATPDVHVTGRRIVATIIDGFVLGVLYQITAWIFGADVDYSSDVDWTRLRTPAGVGSLLFAVMYYVLMEAYLGRTVGKMVVGIRVISARTGESPGTLQALVRTLMRVIDGIGGYLLGFVVVICSGRRRRLGDMVAETQVIRA